MSGLIFRGKTWHLRRRVPMRFQEVEPRKELWLSLHTDSRRVAAQKVDGVWNEQIEAWEARLAGRDGDAITRFRAAQELAAKRGFQFLTSDDVAALPIDDLLDRIAAIPEDNGVPDEIEAAALLGTAEAPRLKLSQLVDHTRQLLAHNNRYKNDDQLRKWLNPRKRAVANFIDALGSDSAVLDIGSDQAIKFRSWWKKRLAAEGQKHSTANKDFNYLAGMISAFYEDLGVSNPPRPFAGVSIRDRYAAQDRKREVSTEWIRDKWLVPGAFDGLNDQARDILLISLETGCRQSEIYNLPASAIVLDDAIPHIKIGNEQSDDPNDRREVKNQASVRLMPLVGLALAAAKRHPEGFPRYRAKSSYSAAVNKFLKENDLLPEGVTIGGLRHSWESRLKAAGVSSDDRGELMGHSLKRIRGREVYGDDLQLAFRKDIMEQLVFPVPDHLR